jgi:hypothetical protein
LHEGLTRDLAILLKLAAVPLVSATRPKPTTSPLYRPSSVTPQPPSLALHRDGELWGSPRWPRSAGSFRSVRAAGWRPRYRIERLREAPVDGAGFSVFVVSVCEPQPSANAGAVAKAIIRAARTNKRFMAGFSLYPCLSTLPIPSRIATPTSPDMHSR